MAGPRKKDDPQNIEGSGYHYRDRVKVTHLARATEGIVEAIHQDGKKIDVRIDSPGHPEHGRVVTFAPNELEPHEDLLKRVGGKSESAKS